MSTQPTAPQRNPMSLAAMNAALAAAIAAALSVLLFSLGGFTMGQAIMYALGIAVLTFGLVWLGIFAVLRARTPRDR